MGGGDEPVGETTQLRQTGLGKRERVWLENRRRERVVLISVAAVVWSTLRVIFSHGNERIVDRCVLC